MPQEIISRKTKINLETLRKAGILKDFYLAGGTGLALQLEHRLSFDLDFFSFKKLNTKNLIQRIKKAGKVSIEKEAENTLICNFNGTRLTFLKYDYPLLFSLKKIEGIEVAAARDIGCMKIDAVSARGTKKDFIDIFFINKKITPLKNLLELFEKKYKSINYNMMHILKSLTYFEDAKKDPMPRMIIQVSWEEVKDFFREEIAKFLKHS
jgi:hypothetical protein